MSPDNGEHITESGDLLAVPGRHARQARSYQDTRPDQRVPPGWRGQRAVEWSARWRDPTTGVASRCPSGHDFPQTLLPDSSAKCASLTICSAFCVRSVEQMAFGGRLPDGSRVSTQRMGKGSEPERYHNAVPVHICTARSLSPYQSRVSFCQTVSESCKTCCSAGRLLPTRGRPVVCRLRSGGGSWSTASSRPVVIRVTRLGIGMQAQFQHIVSCITHQLDGTGRRAIDSPLADHLMRPHRDGLVSLAQPFTDLQSGCQHTQKGQGPALLRPRHGDDDRHHDPSQAKTAHRPVVAREGAIALMPWFADLAAPASLQRFVNHQIHAGAGWHKGLDEDQEQLPTDG
jgi:hypothetical protein